MYDKNTEMSNAALLKPHQLKTTRLMVSLSPDEKSHLEWMSKRLNLAQSEVIRRGICMFAEKLEQQHIATK